MGRLLIGIVFLAALVAAPPAHAAQINVNTTVDELNNDGDCSLREAVKSAKDDLSPDACEPGLGADTIIVPAGTYNLLSQLIIQDNEVTVDGAGQASTIIAGGNVSVIGPAVPDPVWIQDLTVRDSPGTGILNSGHLTLDHVTATANGFSGVSGANTILDSSIDANSGSGISGGDIVIMNSTVRDNGGLGVQIGGNATITGSTISGNEDVGILNFNALIVTDSTISGNTSDFGGGIRNFAVDSQTATITLDGVTVSGNSATGGGGGIASVGGGVSNVTISESTIAGNQAPGGGGIAGQGTTTIENSTISGNSATAGEGGGISNGSGAPTSVMTVTNSTVSGNDATGEGGGILSGATTSLNFTTVADNTTTTGGGGLNVGGGAGGIPVTLHGTILADNTGPHEDCFGAVTSQGYNLIESGAACEPIGGDTTGNVLGQDPLLDPLANSGGPTETHALMTLGSAALNSGGPSCPATDQRGVLRPQGAGCDMGAFEREAPPETTITSGLGEGATISNPSPSFGFSSVEPGATFECKVDSGPFSPCTSPTTIGPLANGMHNFQVRARDLDNEVDPTPESRTFTVAVPPAPPTSLAPTITLPSSLFNFTVNGTSLQVSVSSPGTISVVDVRAPLTASIAKKKKRKRSLLLNPSSASGGPPTITVPLRLTKLAKGELRKKGKVTVNARITFTPQGGTASTRTAGLKVAVKKKGSKKRNRSASLFLEGPLDLARE